MNKMQMAHQMALAIQGTKLLHDMELVSDMAWKYADAMQAKADEREDKTRPKALLTKDKDGKCLHFNHEFGHKKCMDCGASLEEWQPDWSQAPDDKITHWSMEKDNRYSWWIGEPKKDSQNHYESIENANCSFYGDAPSFNYQGNWQDSLRKRPQ